MIDPSHRAPRSAPAHRRVELRCADWRFVGQLIAMNASPGGLFICTREPCAVGTRLELMLHLPDGTTKSLPGTVSRVLTPEAALREHGAPGVCFQCDASAAIDLMIVEELARQAHPASSPPPAAPQVVRAGEGAICPVVGIDFGTTYSSVSVALGNRVHLLSDELGRTLHPSIVAFPEPGGAVAGWEARELMLAQPHRAVCGSKRLLGRQFDGADIGPMLQSMTVSTARGMGGLVIVEIDGQTHPVVEICARVIGKLKQIAERKLGREVTRAAFSIPASFQQPQLEALMRAARMAGVECVGTIPEPVAGALSHGVPERSNECVAAYDFGGGTFDFGVVDFAEGRYRVLGSGGEPWLGGDDFDVALANDAANAFWRTTRLQLQQRQVEWARLINACERAKRELSDTDQAEVALGLEIAGRKYELRHGLTRHMLEELCAPLVERSLDVCREVMSRLRLSPKSVAEVVMTGGVSRTPFVRAAVSRLFGRQIGQIVSPEEAVALGAGVRAAELANHAVTGVSADPL